MSDEELEEKGVLGATLGELREAFQQGRAGGDGGAASVVGGEARDVVSRAGREAETRGRGPGRPRKPVPETSKPQAGGIGSAVGATLDAVTPGQLPIDGDGDERVFDNTPQERAATPAEIAASRAGGMVREAAQSAVPGQGADGTRGSSPEGISQRIARSAGRMAARVVGRKPGGGEPKQTARGWEMFEDASHPRPSEALRREVKHNRGAVARLVPKSIRNLAEDEVRLIEDVENPHTREDAEFHVHQLMAVTGRSRDELTDDEWDELVERTRSSLNRERPMGEFKPRRGAEAQQEMEDLVAVAMDRSPVLRELVERHGLPKLMVYDDMSTTFNSNQMPMSKQAAAERMARVNGFWQSQTNTLALNGRLFDSDPDLPDSLPNEYGFGTRRAMIRTFRHELGHRLAGQAAEGFGEDGVDPEKAAAVEDIMKYFNQKHAPMTDIRKEMNRIYDKQGEAAAKAYKDGLRDNEKFFLDQTLWMSTYGHTNADEFLAELFTISTSDEFNVRESVPQPLRPMVKQWLGLDPWQMADDHEAELYPERPAMPARVET